MAVLSFEDGRKLTALDEIQKELAPLEVRLSSWPIDRGAEWSKLLDRPELNDEEKEEVLKGCDKYFKQLQEELGYQTRDLIVLHPNLTGLDGLLQKFDRTHTHDDDEVRYIVDGVGVFGFVRPDGSQVTLEIHPEEFINVPKNTEHWFLLKESKRIKAVRYFTSMEGWTPKYTETERRV